MELGVEFSYQLSYLITLKFFFFGNFVSECYQRFKLIGQVQWNTTEEQEYTKESLTEGLRDLINECSDFLKELELDES